MRRWPAMPLLLVGIVQAHDVISTKITFSREISRVFYKRCAGCHREGGEAPMSLMTYEEARPWAKAIKEEVLERRMPPWGVVKGFGAFRDDPSLTQDEIQLIADWVEGGAPEGEAKYLPPAPAAAAPLHVIGRRVPLRAGTPIAGAGLLLGIEPKLKTATESVRVWADLPDGTTEPLIWLRRYKPEFRRAFAFRKPLPVAPGTRIRVEPEGQAEFVLIQK